MLNNQLIFLASLLSLVKTATSEPEGFIVGVEYAKIQSFPYSAFLAISCNTAHTVEMLSCGSAILNQAILITAAHCLEECLPSSFIGIGVGSERKMKGIRRFARIFSIHPNYNRKTIQNDVALIRMTKQLVFNSNVKKVALYKNPPYNEPALVAGWGLVDEDKHIGTLYLKQAQQTVWSREKCTKVLLALNKGSICAGPTRGSVGYAAQGDSGSGLAIRGWMLIGLVSFKQPSLAINVVVYTDVAYYYNWIKKTSQQLYCLGKD